MSAVWLRERWEALARRERAMVALAVALLLAAALWSLGLAPALAVLRTSEAQQAELDAQLQQMLALQAQARALQAQPRMSFDDALRALDASVKQRLGPSAQMSVAGERVSVTLKAVPPEILAQWLTQVRIGARAVPAEARLARTASTAGTATATAAGTPAPAPGWDGTLVLSLPAR